MKKLNRQAVQKHLDVISEALEANGFEDLSNRIDYYNDRLLNASVDEASLIKRALSRIAEEIRKRVALKNKQEVKDEKSAKADAAVDNTRRASDTRKEILRKRLAALKANRDKISKRLEALRASKQADAKDTDKEGLKASRKERLSKKD